MIKNDEHTGGRQIPRARPEPTTMPGDGESHDAPLPTARVHGARAHAWLSTIAIIAVIVGGLFSYGKLLNRIDLVRAEAHRAYAHTAILEARLVQLTHRDVKPPNDPRVDVCLKRTTALRGAIHSLIKTGAVALTDPGWEWIDWAEVRR